VSAPEETPPPRLVDDPATSAELREGLAALGRQAIPTDVLARIAANVASAPTPPASASGAPVAGKIGLVAGAAALAVGAVVLFANPSQTPAPTAPAAASSRRAIETAPQVAQPAPPETTSVPATPVSPKASAFSATSVSASPKPSAAAAALPDEATLFRQAGDALRAGEASRTLALVDELERRFPSGTFAQEREVLRIEALTRVGREDEARARARAFLSAHPESAHRPRLERLLTSP
jgi:hypothetical protein